MIQSIHKVSSTVFLFSVSLIVLAALTLAGTTLAGDVTMTTGQGKTYTLTVHELPNSREYRYCELVFIYGDKGSDIYSTSPLAECSLDWWESLDTDALAKEFGATSIYKNGPQWWSMDEVGVMCSEPVDVAGTHMVLVAHLPPGTTSTPVYEVFDPAKYQDLTYKAGEPTYQLVDPDGHVYIVQGHKIKVDELATLGDQFKKLPDGWKYQVVHPDEDIVMNLTPAHAIPSVIDEFDQIYIRIPE
jgi:hypothetical protein